MRARRNKIGKSRKTNSTGKASQVRPVLLGNITENQLSSFLSIRKFEVKNFIKIGKSGISGKSLAKDSEAKKEFLNQNSNFINQEYSRSTSQLRILASVPLMLPNRIKELVNEGKVKKISVIPDLRSNKVKITLLDITGRERTLVDSRENSFKNQSLKDADIGLNILDDSKLIISLPLSPPSLESNSSKNQGNVLYRVALEGEKRENV